MVENICRDLHAALPHWGIAQCYAHCDHAFNELGWRATETLQAMCEDTWRWQSANPNGFAV